MMEGVSSQAGLANWLDRDIFSTHPVKEYSPGTDRSPYGSGQECYPYAF
jgi:hypothetical protein